MPAQTLFGDGWAPGQTASLLAKGALSLPAFLSRSESTNSCNAADCWIPGYTPGQRTTCWRRRHARRGVLSRPGQDPDRITTQNSRNTGDFGPARSVASRSRTSSISISTFTGGHFDWDAELAIPSRAVPPPPRPVRSARLDELMAPDWSTTSAYRRDSRFHPGGAHGHQTTHAASPQAKEAQVADINLRGLRGQAQPRRL